ncbi:hypothetical protein UXP63_03745, partial [Enterobacter hormaechei]
MATTPTQKPVPSESPIDLKYNAGKIDEFVTSLVNTYVDRFGNEHYTIEGLRWLAQQAISQYGWILTDSFQDGADITLPNQALRDEETGEYFRWDGALPKHVDPGSTPSSTGGIGIGAWVGIGDASLRTMLASADDAKGASLVAWERKQLKSSIGTVQGMLDAQYVNVWEFADLITSKPSASDPNTWDWTPALQAALNFIGHTELNPGVSGGCVVIPPIKKDSVYRVTEIEVPIDVAIFAYGSTVAPVDQAQTHTHLFKFMGMNKVAGLQIAMDYSLAYESAIWCRGRNIDFSSCAVWFSKNAVTVGDPAWATTPADAWLGDSEISFTNCQFNWCLRTCTAYGLNTIVTFGGGSRCYANRGSIPAEHPNSAAWATTPMGNFLNYGALIYVIGAFAGTFSRDVPTFQSECLQVSRTDYNNSYGRYFVDGTHIETSFLFFAPAPVGFFAQDNITKALVVNNCHGHVATSPTDLYWINASSQLTQGIHIDSSCSFYGTHGTVPTRTKCLIAPNSPVHISAGAFSCIAGDFKDACVYTYPYDKSSLMMVNAF